MHWKMSLEKALDILIQKPVSVLWSGYIRRLNVEGISIRAGENDLVAVFKLDTNKQLTRQKSGDYLQCADSLIVCIKADRLDYRLLIVESKNSANLKKATNQLESAYNILKEMKIISDARKVKFLIVAKKSVLNKDRLKKQIAEIDGIAVKTVRGKEIDLEVFF